jgi:cell division protein ZapA
MPSYNKLILGLEISFKTDAEPDRVEHAKALVEERFKLLNPGDKNLSKEKLLTFVALGLADDLLMAVRRLGEMENKLDRLVDKIRVPGVK